MKDKQSGGMTLFNLLGGKSTGLWLALRKCFCELKRYKLGKSLSLGGGRLPEKYALPVSVIICTCNRTEKLLDAVSSVRNQTLDGSQYEIIVVNNGTEFDGRVSGKLWDVSVIEERRQGLSYARNTGAKAAKGRYLVFIDDDAVARPNLLELVKDAFDKHKKAGIVGGQILLRAEPSCLDIVLPGHESVWSQYTVSYKRYREVSRQYEFPFGANFSVRHSVLDASGGFDESYGRIGDDFGGGEETALCFKTLKLGYKIGIEPRAVVYHRVDRERFTKEHIRRTIRAGILTTYRLYRDGYSPAAWDKSYAEERVRIAEKEILRLKGNKAEELEIFYKECEKNGFEELAQSI